MARSDKKAARKAAAADAAAAQTDRLQAPEADSGRRLSPWRVIGAALVASRGSPPSWM